MGKEKERKGEKGVQEEKMEERRREKGRGKTGRREEVSG